MRNITIIAIISVIILHNLSFICFLLGRLNFRTSNHFPRNKVSQAKYIWFILDRAYFKYRIIHLTWRRSRLNCSSFQDKLISLITLGEHTILPIMDNLYKLIIVDFIVVFFVALISN